jgi:hypothetical protein
MFRKERSDFTYSTLAPIYKNYPKVSARMFDVEAFSADCSETVMYKTDSIQEDQFMIDTIRDTDMFTALFL